MGAKSDLIEVPPGYVPSVDDLLLQEHPCAVRIPRAPLERPPRLWIPRWLAATLDELEVRAFTPDFIPRPPVHLDRIALLKVRPTPEQQAALESAHALGGVPAVLALIRELYARQDA